MDSSRGRGRGRGRPVAEEEPDEACIVDDDEEEEPVVVVGRGRGLGRGQQERTPGTGQNVPVQVPPRPAEIPSPVRAPVIVEEPPVVQIEELSLRVVPEPVGEPRVVPEPVVEARVGEAHSILSIPTTTSQESAPHEGRAPSITTRAPSTLHPAPTDASKWSTESRVAARAQEARAAAAAAAVAAAAASAAPIPAPAPVPVPRPSKPERTKVIKQGIKGESTPLATNFVRLNYINKGRIFEYHVEFDPPLDSTRMKKSAMREVMKEKAYSFDGTMLFLPEKKNGDVLKFETHHPNMDEKRLFLTAMFVKEKAPNDLIQFFNILFKQMMRVLNRVQLRQNYYDVTNVKTLAQHRLDIWPGYCIAVEEQEGGLMICLDVSHRVLRQDTVLEQYRMMKGINADWKEKFMEFIVGKIVLTRYNNACYKIDDIWWDSRPMDTFVKREREITYKDYYEEHHGVGVHDMEQPMLVSRIKPRRGDLIQEEKTVALVPELCYITGLTDDQRSNFTVMKDLGEHTRLSPAQRKKALENFIREVNETKDAKAILQQWNLELEDTPVHMEGRIHAGPKLSFGKREVNVQAEFTKDALSGVVNAQRVEKYLLICTQRDTDKGRKFAETYRKVCQQLGIPTTVMPTILPIKGMQVNDFRRAIKDNLTKEFQFLFCLMPQQRDDVYSLVKKLCVSELEVPSQCCLTKTLNNEKRFNSVVQKIALQINCKLGGALWALKMPFDTPIMFVGIDVAHDPKKKNPSVLGLVVTLNNECSKYASFCRILKVHQETADSLSSCFEEALETFNEFQGRYPERIVIWRDGGLAEPSSHKHEVQQVQQAINAKCGKETKFSFVVVQKRIPQRFFKTGRTGQNWENCTPGTVIDHTVTKYDAYDFYVVSQLVRQGTVTPTHYTVITDVGDTKPDLIQKFAYVCSFMYYNWPGTVRVPAMTQYAHKLAGLVANNVRANPGKTLRDTLYYL